MWEPAEEVGALWAKVKDRAEVIYALDDFDKGALRHPRRRILSGIRRAVEENLEGASNSRL